MFSQTLGTALGDWTADSVGLGYGGAALLFAALLSLVALALAFTRISRTALFWTAFVLTRPLGATLGDTLTKPVAEGGLHFGRFTSSLVIAVGMVILIATTSLRKRATPVPASGEPRPRSVPAT